MVLPSALRSRTPAAVKNHRTVRAAALAIGVIPPRPMHTDAERDVLHRLAAGASCVVEIGVYEGSSAVVFCRALDRNAALHLIDPFIDATGWTMRSGWRGTPLATRLAVQRHARHGPRIHWHIARSQDVGRDWRDAAPDLVFIDGDHSPAGCREDWLVWHRHVRVGGAVAFHDARLGRPDGSGGAGPTQVVDELRERLPPGWRIDTEVDTLVVLRHDG